MDSISNANVIIWLFFGTILFLLLAVIVTVGVWVESEKVSKLFYSAGVIVTFIIMFIDIQIVFFSTAYEPAFVHFLIYGKVLTIIGVGLLCGSVLLQIKNNKSLRNVLFNFSTIGGLVLCAYLAHIK